MPTPEGVRAWQAAVQVAVRTRQLLAQLPPRGYAELRDQMTRSSESIGHNIAEGRGSKFPLEYIRFLDTAARSATELWGQLSHAMEYGIVPKRTALDLQSTAKCVHKMIESLSESVLAEYEAEKARRKRQKARRKSKKKRNG